MATIDDLLDRWEEAREQGDDVSPEELCADHPELLPGVKAQIEVLLRFESNFGFQIQTGAPRPSKSTKAYEPPAELTLGSRYRLQGCHAVGGLGQVFLAFDDVLQRRVAIKFPKMLGMTGQQIARFEQEARITGQLDHPGIVPIHAMASSTGHDPCYVMRFVEGKTLDEAVRVARESATLANARAYFESDALRSLLQSVIAVCNTVAFAHDRKVVHRDIKPNNILIGPFGETLLLDWGIAKAVEFTADAPAHSVSGSEIFPAPLRPPASASGDSPQLTEPGHGLGTPAYASPEQLLGLVAASGFASDVYSLGATLFYVLTGEAPLEAIGWSEYLVRIRHPGTELARLLPVHVPAALRGICAKCLRIDPSERYESAQAIAKDLDHFLAGDPVSVLTESWWVRMARRLRRHPAITSGIAVGIIALAGAGVIGSIVVGGKNQLLTDANTRLQTSLKTSEEANAIAMASLRSMVNEAVSHRMVQREALSDADRSYIQTILRQYLALASLQGNAEQTVAIRAEAEGQVGGLYYQLNQHADAIHHLESCRDFYRQLGGLRQLDSDVFTLAGYLEILSSVQFEDGHFPECVAASTEAITALTSLLADPSSVAEKKDHTEQISVLVNLLFLRGEARQKLGAHNDSREDFRLATEQLDALIATRPDDPAVRFSAGNYLRTFAAFLNGEASTEAGREEALTIATRAVDCLNVVAEKNPDVHRYASALAWACYDRSEILEELNRIDDAITDMWRAVDLTEKLAERYPLIKPYRQRYPAMLARRCRLLLKAANVSSAYSDARNFSDLALNRDECSEGIELIQLCIEADSDDHVLDRSDAICHLAHLFAQRARAYQMNGDGDKALSDFDESLKRIESLNGQAIPVTYRSFAYLWSLERIETLIELRKFDEARSFFEQATAGREAVRNLFDQGQQESIDQQLESYRSQLHAAPKQ